MGESRYKWWHFGCEAGWLDRTRPKPRWLELEPGEEYLGSYPRWRMRFAFWETAYIFILFTLFMSNTGGSSVTQVHGLFPGLKMTSVTWLPLLGILAVELYAQANRVYATSKALVFKERKEYRIIELAQITGVDYTDDVPKHHVRLHLAGEPRPLVLMDSVCPRQSAEELVSLLSQYGGREIEVMKCRK